MINKVAVINSDCSRNKVYYFVYPWNNLGGKIQDMNFLNWKLVQIRDYAYIRIDSAYYLRYIWYEHFASRMNSWNTYLKYIWIKVNCFEAL
jgi:hypothetical protein